MNSFDFALLLRNCEAIQNLKQQVISGLLLLMHELLEGSNVKNRFIPGSLVLSVTTAQIYWIVSRDEQDGLVARAYKEGESTPLLEVNSDRRQPGPNNHIGGRDVLILHESIGELIGVAVTLFPRLQSAVEFYLKFAG